MFCAMAIGLVSIWLLTSYGLEKGLVFTLLITVAVTCICSGRRRTAVGAVVLCLCCWAALELFLPYTGWKNRIRWEIGVERLQDWAVSRLDSHDAIDRPDAIEDIPEDIRSVLPNAYVVPETSIAQKHIWFPVDPKRDSHGFRVGRPGFVPLPTKRLTDKLADGVWGYYPDSGLW